MNIIRCVAFYMSICILGVCDCEGMLSYEFMCVCVLCYVVAFCSCLRMKAFAVIQTFCFAGGGKH